MTVADVIGGLASCASVASFAPQAWRVVTTRDVSALSWKMYVLTVGGFALWTSYGVALGSWPIIVTNSLCLVLSAFILSMLLVPERLRARLGVRIDPSSPLARDRRRASSGLAPDGHRAHTSRELRTSARTSNRSRQAQ